MAILDVREHPDEETSSILFSEFNHKYLESVSTLRKDKMFEGIVDIVDTQGCFVRVATKDQALNLSKALNKAIELGWLK